MSEERKTAAELQVELNASIGRLKHLQAEEERLNEKAKRVREEIRELNGSIYGYGTIQRLREQLAYARRREETAKLPVVRLKNAGEFDGQWAFVKKTPKRIYLRNIDQLSRMDDFWDLDGKAAYRKSIHPKDLAKILDGSIGNA